MTDVEEGVEVDLRQSGLLWLINRVCFHPRGFALGIEEDGHRLFLLGDGSEPWRYEGPGPEEDELFRRAEETLGKRTAVSGGAQ